MGYNIYLRDPVTGKAAEVPGHLMGGGIYVANYRPESGMFTAACKTEAHVNITYNYGRHYYEIYEEDEIRVIYGMSGVDSISVLEKWLLICGRNIKNGGLLAGNCGECHKAALPVDCSGKNETRLYMGWDEYILLSVLTTCEAAVCGKMNNKELLQVYCGGMLKKELFMK